MISNSDMGLLEEVRSSLAASGDQFSISINIFPKYISYILFVDGDLISLQSSERVDGELGLFGSKEPVIELYKEFTTWCNTRPSS